MKKARNKTRLDFVSGAVFLFVVLTVPLTYYYGVSRPQDLRKRASQEDKMLVLIRDYKSPSAIEERFNIEIVKPEGAQDMRFDLDDNGVINGVDYGMILKSYEEQ